MIPFRKIAALYHNEMIKIVRKVSVWVILGIMVAGVFGIAGLMKLSSSVEQGYEVQAETDYATYARKNMEDSLAQYRGDLESYRSQLASTQDETVRARLESQIAEAEKQAALYEEALKRDILIYYNYNDPFEILALNEYIEYQFEIEALRDAPAGDVESAKQLKKAEEYLALLTTALDNQDYASYLDLQNRIIQDDTTISDEEKAMLISLNELRLKVDPQGERPQSI